MLGRHCPLHLGSALLPGATYSIAVPLPETERLQPLAIPYHSGFFFSSTLYLLALKKDPLGNRQRS